MMMMTMMMMMCICESVHARPWKKLRMNTWLTS